MGNQLRSVSANFPIDVHVSRGECQVNEKPRSPTDKSQQKVTICSEDSEAPQGGYTGDGSQLAEEEQLDYTEMSSQSSTGAPRR